MSKTKKPRKPREISDRYRFTGMVVHPGGLEMNQAMFVATTPKERERLADWLRRAADWLEAQE